MAKPYLIFKVHNGIYYAQIRLADGTHANKKSTGGRNRAEAECKVMEWIVTGNIPVRVNSKDSKVQSIDRIRLFNDLRTAEFDSDDINNIIKILKERNYLYSTVASTSKGSIPIEDFLENFWDYDKSPYVKEKPGKKQSIHRQYCATLLSRIRLYWIPRLTGKCVAEITRKDVDAFFSSDEAKIANEFAMHTGMRAGEIQTLTVDDLGEDEIYVRRSWSKDMASNAVKTVKNVMLWPSPVIRLKLCLITMEHILKIRKLLNWLAML